MHTTGAPDARAGIDQQGYCRFQECTIPIPTSIQPRINVYRDVFLSRGADQGCDFVCFDRALWVRNGEEISSFQLMQIATATARRANPSSGKPTSGAT
jgi:hypothetical protein